MLSKNLLQSISLKLAAIIFILFTFASCQKEKKTPAAEESIVDLGNGIIETRRGGPNGGSVIFSNWIQKTTNDWFSYGSKVTTDILTPSLTDAVRDRGLVLVYFNLSNYISQLPNQSLGENLLLDYYFETGKIITRYTFGGGQIYGDILNVKFRYVLIPASALGGQAGRASFPVDLNDYNAVCAYYGINP